MFMIRIRFQAISLFLVQVFVVHRGSAFTVTGKVYRYHSAVFGSSGSDLYRSCDAYLEFQHCPTNVTVTLVGCLHGSVSSANDVSQALCRQNTDAVVLELCPSRYGTIQRRLFHSNGGLPATSDKLIRSMRKDQTFGLSASLLGGVSTLQASLSGFQPGLEFITAIEYVEAINEERRVCDLILADQAVGVTLERMDALPKVSFDMLTNLVANRFCWSGSLYDIQSKALLEAIWGRLDLGRVLSRSYQAFIDLIKLTLPPIILLQTILFLSSNLLGRMINANVPDTHMKADVATLSADILMHLSLSAVVMYLSYLLIVLPLVQVVIQERDDQIASGIDAACCLLRQRESYNGGDCNPRVVAVLGLLHVNGVAKRLIDQCDLKI